MNMITARTLEATAMLMIGDGLLACASPRGHARLWLKGPRPWRRMILPFVRRPTLTTGIGAAELAAGLVLARYAQKARRTR